MQTSRPKPKQILTKNIIDKKDAEMDDIKKIHQEREHNLKKQLEQQKKNFYPTCCVCMIEHLSIMVRPCNHICCCQGCLPFLQNICPICKKRINSSERVYMS